MNQINFMVNNLGNSQLSYMLIRNINNEYINNNHDIDYIVFYDVLAARLMIKPMFSCMSSCENYGQSGYTVATSSDQAMRLLKTAGCQRRILYLWDLDWIRGQQRHSYPLFSQIYHDPSLEIICRSESHAKLLENSFNVKPIGIVEDFNLKQLKEVLCI
jgi:hypothetical protein